MANKESFSLCIHGHFYQPPRENPWIEEIEIQESARPFHDWNERIHRECYQPNTQARVLDNLGFIINIVNNFEKISFNVGPTLLSWLETKHPATYEKILEADRLSAKKFSGHGNAIAQVYNHIILPLASRRDKVTQVRWGVEEFKARFKRMPESIWLAETACDEETLEVLVEEGMKYLILSPHQADAVRSLESEKWEDVSNGNINPKQPYRCFLKKDAKKFIDIFFYDGPISKAVGFGDLLFDAKRFMDRFDMARFYGGECSQLLHVATDGETFGHHKPFGDRVLAYLTQVEAERRRYSVVNYGYYLAANPPEYAVRLKEGENGEGTSWSCPHGVRRWKDHCGCRGEGPVEWTQHWRKPLREALDWLRDELAFVFESTASRYLLDAWKARNEYIRVILNRSEEQGRRFIERHQIRELSVEEKIVCLKLLEMQRHAMLMYTSCGWFFTELSGIETEQILQYAARAIQLAAEISDRDLEEEFLKKLSLAKSNIPELKDGRGIYEKFVAPRVLTIEQAASFYALGSLIDETYEQTENFNLYCFRFEILHTRKEAFGDLTLSFGRLRVTSQITWENKDLIFIAVHMGQYDFRCSVKPFTHAEELEKIERIFFEDLEELHLVELFRKMDDFFGEKYYDLKDLPLREKIKIVSILTREGIEKISEELESLYDTNRRMSEIYRSLNLPLPEQIRYAAELTLRRRLELALTELARQGFNSKKTLPLTRILDNARAFEVKIHKEMAAQFLKRELEKRVDRFVRAPHPEILTECQDIFKIARKIKLEITHGRAQEKLFALLTRWTIDPRLIPAPVRDSSLILFQLINELQINGDELKKALQPKPL